MASSPPFVAGIDPGLDGAVALIGRGKVIVEDMPTSQIRVGDGFRRILDIGKLAGFFSLYACAVSRCTIEDPNSMPGDGHMQAFKFGFNCGVVQALVHALLGIAPQLVKPNVWKGAMGLSSNKNESRVLASKIAPQFSKLWTRAKDDGRAEAFLIGVYGSKA